jgi:hypothetical protein
MSQDAEWWSTITPGVILARCHYGGAKNAKEIGALRSAELGIEYTGRTKVSCRWPDISNLQLLESQTRRGRQRSAFGIGPVGVAFVGATALKNKRNAQIVVKRVVRLTTMKGQHGDFVLIDASAQELALVQAIIAHLRKAEEAQRARGTP